ncbi:hypothetical protein RXV90_16305, partial [Rhodophyticola sp. MJ-SS7]|nr:hypothetical protein [Rhodophyticola sp. MJ-SS7]
ASDDDGDKLVLDNGLLVDIENDAPVQNTATVLKTVHEDALNNYDPDDVVPVGGDNVIGSTGNETGAEVGNKTTTAAILYEDLIQLVTVGADEPASFALVTGSDATALTGTDVTRLAVAGDNADAERLTSQGDGIYWYVDTAGDFGDEGDILGVTLLDDTATGAKPDDLTADNVDRVIFRIEPIEDDDNTGDAETPETEMFQFVLLDQVDNDDDDDLDTGEGEGDKDRIDIAGAFEASDDDGDKLVLDNGLLVDIENDAPVPDGQASAVTGAVAEDYLDSADSDADDNDDVDDAAGSDANPNDGDDDDGDGFDDNDVDDLSIGNIEGGSNSDGDETGGAAGSLTALFSVGADEPLTTSLTVGNVGSDMPALTSKGDALSYNVVGYDTDADSKDDAWILSATAGGRLVFSLRVNADGSWLYDLDDQLDHDVTLRVRGNDATDLSSLTNGVDTITLKDAEGTTLSSYTYTTGDGLAQLEAALEQNGVDVTFTSTGEIEIRYEGVLEVEGTTDILTLLGLGASDTVYDPDQSTWLLVAGGDSIDAIDFSPILEGTDFDGDKVIGVPAGQFTVAVENDVPIEFFPENGFLFNDGTIGTENNTFALGWDGAVGADEIGAVYFAGSLDGANALDTDGNQIFAITDSGRKAVSYLLYDSDLDGTDDMLVGVTNVVDATTNFVPTNDYTAITAPDWLAFIVELDADTDSYSVEYFDVLATGAEFRDINFADAKGGNENLAGVGANDDNNEIDFLISGNDSVNTSDFSVGVGAGQSIGDLIEVAPDVFEPESVRFDFVTELTWSGPPDKYFYYDTVLTASAFRQVIEDVNSSDPTTSFKIEILSNDDVGPGEELDDTPTATLYGDPNDVALVMEYVVILDDADNIQRVYYNGTWGTDDFEINIPGFDEPVLVSHTLVMDLGNDANLFGGDGKSLITEDIMQKDWEYAVVGQDFTSVQITALNVDEEPDFSKFKLGIFSVSLTNPLQPIEMQFDVVGVDEDGDTIDSLFYLNWIPDSGDNFIGTELGNDPLNGNANANIIAGLDGNDVINGLAGNDTIYGGLGADTLTGGADADSFVFMSLNELPDAITDFEADSLDTLVFYASGFSPLVAGTLDASSFVSGTNVDAISAADANDFFLYDTDSGNLFFDADGAGGDDAVLVASITVASGIFDEDDFLII